MFVIDFSTHLTKKHYPVRNVRISPNSGTLAATFGKEGRAEHVAWWSLTEGKLIAATVICPEDLENPVDPTFPANLSWCAAHGQTFTGTVDFVSRVEPLDGTICEREYYFGDSVSDPQINAICSRPDGRWLLAAHSCPGEQSGISRWELKQTRRPRAAIALSLDSEEISLKGDDDDRPTRLTVSCDGNRIACARLFGDVQLLDFKTRREVGVLSDALPDHVDPITVGLAFSPDGKRLAVRGGGRVIVFDLSTSMPLAELKPKKLTDMAFTPDGRRMLTGGLDKFVRVWDTTTWKEIARYDWKIGPIHSVTVSPDGAIAAAGGDKSRVVVWDLDG